MFTLSVIIPVYNGEKFISHAVRSALQCPEVTEILIINDGSTDNTLIECKKFIGEDKVNIFHHEGRLNQGVSSSRNLGIKVAKSELIAFLDVDDLFLPNRFEHDFFLFKKNPEIDGVYNALGFNYLSEKGKKQYDEKGIIGLTTVSEISTPEHLPYVLLGVSPIHGYFSGVAFTVKKSLFSITGYFNESLTIGEDTELWLKMSIKGHLVGGVIDRPVALRGVHDSNTIVNEKNPNLSKKKMFEELLKWVKSNNVNKNIVHLIDNFVLAYRIRNHEITPSFRLIMFKIKEHPKNIYHQFLIDTLVSTLFNETKLVTLLLRIKNKTFKIFNLKPY